ncbi:MAG: tRNA-queuosine alpha-mannosyltransferase domain-containing protein, partial [Planctomycetota bacterium]
MRILILEPYLTGSHRAWVEGYVSHSRHHVDVLSLKGNFWKWRMHGGAVTLAGMFERSGYRPELILATDMLDLTTFQALTRRKTANIPTAVYFHENQLSYPWSPTDRDVVYKRDKHYGFINYATALTADAVYFNSPYHERSFLLEVDRLLKHFPDYRHTGNVDLIAQKSKVLPVGLDLQRFENSMRSATEKDNARPLILWNHRWEYDKNPAGFFALLYKLEEQNVSFDVAILGECFAKSPPDFEEVKHRLAGRIVQYGYVDSISDYAEWLWRADFLPVTSYQDFFGISIVEAVCCGCRPFLPKRLTYPELVPSHLHDKFLYVDDDDLIMKL